MYIISYCVCHCANSIIYAIYDGPKKSGPVPQTKEPVPKKLFFWNQSHKNKTKNISLLFWVFQAILNILFCWETKIGTGPTEQYSYEYELRDLGHRVWPGALVWPGVAVWPFPVWPANLVCRHLLRIIVDFCFKAV